MNMPPFIMRMKIADKQRHHLNLWIPVCIFWLIAGLIALALSPLVLLLVLILWPTGWGRFLWELGPRFYALLCALKGLEVNVRGRDQVVLYFK
jgi:hypothetical protein